MPQVWLSYPELAGFLGCDVEAARPVAIRHGWARRRCRDGFTRVKLSPAETDRYLRSYGEVPGQTEMLVASLKAMLEEARRPTNPMQRALSAIGLRRIARDRS